MTDVMSESSCIFSLRMKDKTIYCKPPDEMDTTKRMWVSLVVEISLKFQIYNLQQWTSLSDFYLKQSEISMTSIFSYLPQSVVRHIFSFLPQQVWTFLAPQLNDAGTCNYLLSVQEVVYNDS